MSLASIVGRNICTNKKNLYLKHPVELSAVQESVIIKQSNIGNLEIFGNSEIYKCMENCKVNLYNFYLEKVFNTEL